MNIKWALFWILVMFIVILVVKPGRAALDPKASAGAGAGRPAGLCIVAWTVRHGDGRIKARGLRVVPGVCR